MKPEHSKMMVSCPMCGMWVNLQRLLGPFPGLPNAKLLCFGGYRSISWVPFDPDPSMQVGIERAIRDRIEKLMEVLNWHLEKPLSPELSSLSLRDSSASVTFVSPKTGLLSSKYPRRQIPAVPSVSPNLSFQASGSTLKLKESPRER